MHIVITGSTGLLGRALTACFSKETDHTLYPLSFSRAQQPEWKVDLTDPVALAQFFETHPVDYVVHAAAERRPDAVKNDPSGALALNVSATEQLAELSKIHDFKIIYISTDYVFDGTQPPYDTTATPAPINDYGHNKLAGEQPILAVDGTVLRIPILYGPVEYLSESAVTVIAENLQKNPATTMDNWAIRRPTHVMDIARACVHLTQLAENGATISGIWHCSAPKAYTKYEMALEMADVIKCPKSAILPQNQPADETPRPHDCTLDTSRLAATGYQPMYTFSETIGQIIQPHLD